MELEAGHHDEEAHENSGGLDGLTGHRLDWLKVGVAALFLVEQVAGTFVPLLLLNSKRMEEGLSLLNCFAAGTFLSAGMGPSRCCTAVPWRC